ncbi:hypothetical protein [Hyphomicrobium sp.]|uniref:hypothetical protein n=1 Tax=Hyphomicrobium sp. TaxID=82 RepID=UPI002CF18D99|nr:hypothetical protein [Hyphomicrobium sp.]HRQ25798.1 hypothetical protein [Hyphomicrobium sp.]
MSKLKAAVDDIADVPAELHDFYQWADGKFRLNTDLNDAIAERDQEISALRSSVIDAVATAEIVKANGSPKLLLAHIRSQARIAQVNGRPVVEVVDGAGNVRVDGRGNNLSIAGLVAEMRREDPFSVAFENPSDGKAPPRGIRRSEMTIKQKADYVRDHGQRAFLGLPK